MRPLLRYEHTTYTNARLERRLLVEFLSNCSHREACWGTEGVLWTYGCSSCGRVGRGLTLKLAKEAFAVKREPTSHYPNKEAGGLGDATASNEAPTGRRKAMKPTPATTSGASAATGIDSKEGGIGADKILSAAGPQSSVRTGVAEETDAREDWRSAGIIDPAFWLKGVDSY
jgi:hypothetical protein